MDIRGRLRKHELAGWRSRSLLPTHKCASRQFAPVLKLRGLPYYCTHKHIVNWFGGFSKYLEKIIILSEFDNENSGFAIAIMKNSSSTKEAWEKLHKKCITSKRFVEVFCMLPPNCPLNKCTRIIRNILPKNHVPLDNSSYKNNKLNMNKICAFCCHPLSAHTDNGVVSITAQVALSSGEPLMHISYLSVPALIYNDTSFISDNYEFNPELVQASVEFLTEFPERETEMLQIGSEKFFNLNKLEGYSMRNLLYEIIETIERFGNLSLFELGNYISIIGRAYMFITENKLQIICEKYNMYINAQDISNGIVVKLHKGISKNFIMNDNCNLLKAKKSYKNNYYKVTKNLESLLLECSTFNKLDQSNIQDDLQTRSGGTPLTNDNFAIIMNKPFYDSTIEFDKRFNGILNDILGADQDNTSVSWGL